MRDLGRLLFRIKVISVIFFPNFSLFICRIAVNRTQFSAELTSTRFQILLLLVTILVLSRCDFMFYQLKQIWNLAYQTARKIKNL